MIKEISLNYIKQLCFENFKEYIVETDLQEISQKVVEQLVLDEPYYKKFNVSLNTPSCGFLTLMFYRLCNTIFKKYNIKESEQLITRLKSYSLTNFQNYINPMTEIKTGLVLLGIGCFISQNVTICENVVLYNNVIIGDINFEESVNNVVFIDKNCIINSNVVIYGNIKIGKNVKIFDNAIVRENIDENSTVKIVNQLMIKSGLKSKLPSQNTIIYGLNKKFKNTLVVYGEGIYNPKIIIRTGSKKEVPFELFYWDKNKIILKIKYCKYVEKEIKGSCLVLMSNGNKVTLLNNYVLEKCLLNLCE